MKYFFDLFFAIVIAFILILPIFFICLLIKMTSEGAVIHWSSRVGKDKKIIKMPKFRTMKIGTPVAATHLLSDPNSHLTPVGGFLRRTSLDEIPQLYSVIKGDMSLVGPRPALHNQDDLIALRTQKGVDRLLPGITGWAQVNGRDDLLISDKVALDEEYLDNQSLFFDIKILWLTFLRVIKRDGVSH
jgi:O-antigen biosynthesis protein WbqP